ncbi:hypothetical protein QS257_14410 [Terrilactibacillus sp. S3-3]|nr:hypothetical protein QS257_14410 [Terrilactibacillus sp. S3-3]
MRRFFLLAKAKYAVAVLKLAKLGTVISLFVSLWVYAVFFGWKFAFALMYNMIIHESGHLIAAKQRHVKTSPMFFIPFCRGGYRHERNAETREG